MVDDIRDIAAYYDQSVAAEHARLEQHPLEYDLTWRYLHQYLPPSGTILEVGAATGRYTLPLCQAGYAVTAVDLSPALLTECRRRLAAEHVTDRARLVVADARDLRAVTATDFNAVLLMGPLYHLVVEADRRQALRQAVERLRPGGVLVSVFLSRPGVIGDLLKRTPAWIEHDEEVRSLVEHGRRPEDQPRGGFRGYFATVPEIVPLHEALGIATVVLAGVEPAIGADEDSYRILQPAHRARWLDLLFAVSADPSTIGASRHLLYIGRKGADA